ncbi:MAG: HD domain-containing phosphohydrolase [Candidatus Acidiferrales bacterium]
MNMESPSATVTRSVTNDTPGLRLSDLISALSFALDLTEGQPMGHAVNCCVIGMRLAEILGVAREERSNLYYALLLKDAGCSNNAARMYQIFGGDDIKAKREVKTTDWSRMTFDGLQYLLRNVMPGKSTLERVLSMANVVVNRNSQTSELIELRCERGASIARRIGFSEDTARAIQALDEHWDGKGFPNRLKGEAIPLFARILSVAQTLEVFATLNGPEEALRTIEDRSGTWFDPEVARAAKELRADDKLWAALMDGSARDIAMGLEPEERVMHASEASIDSICNAFAEIIDAKSPYTHRHSLGVEAATTAIGMQLGLPEKDMPVLRRAALLHDIGKLSVPNSILDKPGKLTAQEWETVRLHPYYTQRILERISGFAHLAFLASSHHEKLNGSGYYRNLRGPQLPMSSRAMVVADIYDALAAKRPYRDALPTETVLEIMGKEVPHALDPDCFNALQVWLQKKQA